MNNRVVDIVISGRQKHPTRRRKGFFEMHITTFYLHESVRIKNESRLVEKLRENLNIYVYRILTLTFRIGLRERISLR